MKILTLTSKDWLSGISQGGAFSDEGGLFYKADGITALFSAGSSQSNENGLLMSGGGPETPDPLTNNIFKIIKGNSLIYQDDVIYADTGNNISAEIITTTPSPVVQHTTTNQLFGIATFNGDLFYPQQNQLGRYSTGTWTDNWQVTNQNNVWGAMYNYFDLLLLGNNQGGVDRINSAFTYTVSALQISNQGGDVTAISDDGTYAVIAFTLNTFAHSSLMGETIILFWDGWSDSWLRQYTIPEPYITSLQKTPFGLFAFGETGIWQVSFGGIKKIFSHSPGTYFSTTGLEFHPVETVTSYYSNALVWGGASGTNHAIKSLGKLDTDYLSSYSHPILTPTGKNITAVNAQILKGYVYVADSTSQLATYPISSSATPQTGTSAQTIYFKLPEKMMIKEIVLTFGEPLVSGDIFDVGTKLDESTATMSFGTAQYVSGQSNRRFKLRPTNPVIAEDQVSFVLTFTGGAPKLKTMSVFADPMS